METLEKRDLLLDTWKAIYRTNPNTTLARKDNTLN